MGDLAVLTLIVNWVLINSELGLNQRVHGPRFRHQTRRAVMGVPVSAQWLESVTGGGEIETLNTQGGRGDAVDVVAHLAWLSAGRCGRIDHP